MTNKHGVGVSWDYGSKDRQVFTQTLLVVISPIINNKKMNLLCTF